jgi:hypothetical protein
MDIMRTHPLVIIGGLLRENPFFVPPDEFLLEIHERPLGGKGLQTDNPYDGTIGTTANRRPRTWPIRSAPS